MYQPPTAPLTIGQTLDQGFRLFKASFSSAWPYALVSAVVAVPMNAMAPDTPEEISQGIGGWIAILVVYMLLSLVIFAAMTLRIGAIARGTPISAGESITQGFRRSPSLLGAGILYALGMTFGLLLLVIPGLWFSVMFVFAIYAAVLDGKDPIESFGDSRQMVKGRWWRTAVILTIIVIIVGVVYGLLGFVLGLLIAMGEIGQADTDSIIAILEYVVMPLLQIALLPLTYSLFITFYFDARLRVEGSDLAARIDAAG